MRVQVDESRRDNRTAGIDGALGKAGGPTSDLRDFTVFCPDVGAVARYPCAIYKRSAFDMKVHLGHGVVLLNDRLMIHLAQFPRSEKCDQDNDRDQIAVNPPSTTSSAPVTNEASSLARNTTHHPTSSGCAPRFIGDISINGCSWSRGTMSIIG